MKSLLKEFVNQTDLKKSDGSDAGKSDVSGKANSNDVKFSLMRNTINSSGEVSGSDVANYLEKAHDINDEVDTVLYGLETSDGDVVKVYVNATQADAFEAEMKKLLGMEDDIEEAINDLATRFDIVDVVWPKGQGPDGEGDGPNGEGDEGGELDLDQQAELGDPANGDEPPADEPAPEEDDEMEVIASADDTPAGDEEEVSADGKDKKKPAPKKGADGEDMPPEEGEGNEEGSGEEGEGNEAPTDDEPELDADGNTVKKDKKPKAKEDKGDKHSKLSGVGKAMKTSEHQGDSNMSIGNKFLQRVLSEGRVVEAEDRDRDGVQDGMAIPMDTQQRALANKLKWRLPKQIVQLFAMVGVPGVKLNAADAETSIADAAEMLRSQLSIRRAFLDFFKAMAAVKGYSTAAPGKMEESIKIDEAKLKRGNFTQKTLETILVKLGMPEDLVSTTGPGVVGSALYRTSKEIEGNAELKAKMRVLAMRMGVKAADAMAPLEDKEAVVEAMPARTDMNGNVNIGQNQDAKAVAGLLRALGLNSLISSMDAMVTKRGGYQLPNPSLRTQIMSLTKRLDSMSAQAAPSGESSGAARGTRGGQGTV
jgi:hypothetical protein